MSPDGGPAARILVALVVGCADPDPKPESPAVVEAPTFAGNTFYAGDPHAHTGFSGDAEAHSDACPGCGRFADVFARARAEGLSWLALTDHANGYPAASEEGFAALQAAVAEAHAPEEGFVTLPAAEVWFRAPTGDLGHKTLLLFGDAVPTLDEVQPTPDGGMDVAGCDDIAAWADALEARVGPLLLVPHHPAGWQPMPTDWTCVDPDREPVVEVYSEHGSALDDGFDPPWAGTAPAGTVPRALDPDGHALRLGFVAGTDSHDTLPGEVCGVDLVRTDQPYGGGLTMVPLPEDVPLSREALHDALLDRHAYGTSGPAVVLDVVWSADGVPLGGMGDVLPAADVTVTVRLPDAQAAAVTSVEVVGPTDRRALAPADDGWALAIPAAELPAWLYVAIALDGAALAPDCDDGGVDRTEWAWGSPTWFTAE